MALSNDDKREIREEIRGGLRSFFEELGISPAELAQNLQFIGELRGSIKQIRWATLWTITSLVITGVVGVVVGKFLWN